MNKKIYKRIAIAVFAFFLVFSVSCSNSGDSVKPPASQNASSESEHGEVPPFLDKDIDDIYNLALKATAFADSVSKDYPTLTADKINDGDMLTRWKSEFLGIEEEPSVFGLDWEEEQTFDVIVICWDASHPAEGGFELSLTPDNGASLFVNENEASQETVAEDTESGEGITYRIYRRNTENDDGQRDIIVFSAPVSVSSIRITCTQPYTSVEADEIKERPSCYEMSVYNSQDVQNGTTSELDEEVEELAFINADSLATSNTDTVVSKEN